MASSIAVCLRETSLKKAKRSTCSRLRAARCVESAPSLMKKEPDQNPTDSAEIEALITRIELQDSAHERRRITPAEVSDRVPKLIGNRLAHIFPIYAPGFKASPKFE